MVTRSSRRTSGGGTGRLPDFVVVGPPRTGTTWLYRALRGHVGLPQGYKETDFFTRNYSKGLDWYRSLFAECPAGQPCGELSPGYFASVAARERIARAIPGCAIVAIFRDPVDRAYSFYKLMRLRGWTDLDFEPALDRYPGLADANRYGFHLAAYRALFGEKNTLALNYDDLAAAPERFLARVCEFVGIAPIALEGTGLDGKRVNQVLHAPRSVRLASRAWQVRSWLEARRATSTIELLRRLGFWRLSFKGGATPQRLDPELEARLRERFAPEVEALEQLTGWNLCHWKLPTAAAAAARANA